MRLRHLKDLMHGDVIIQSNSGQGTKIQISLPLRIATENQLHQSDKAKEYKIGLDGMHVLLVEDNELNAEIAMEILKSRGLKVDLAQDGERCISILNEKPEGYYDAVLMDIQMPKMNGYEAAKAIRKGGKNGDIPIIAMTANAFEEDREKALQMGMNAHVAKPIDVDKLFAILEACLKKN